MKTVHISLGDDSYNIRIGKGLFSQIGNLLLDVFTPRKAAVISDTNVAPLYGERIADELRNSWFDVALITFEAGEQHKTLETVSNIYERFFDHGMDRKSPVIAVGGGVVGDTAGMAAATFMRGVPFVQAPTSLMAQVDSSIGGKVAVDHPRGKNMIGAFYQPKAVFIDVDVLKTLPREEFLAGMVEVIKHGVIRDRDFFNYLETHRQEILHLSPEVMAHTVAVSCQIKARVVEEDPKEQGLRAILNYGHTIGHALETATHYRKYRHGEAISIGMVCAAKIARLKGLANDEAVERQIALLQAFGLPVALDAYELRGTFSADTIVQLLYRDKKTIGGKLRFILPTSIGEVVISDEVTEEEIKAVLEETLAQRK